MSITKRDIADIVLVVIAISFVLELSRSIFALSYTLGDSDDLFRRPTKIYHVANILLLLIVNYALLFKRGLTLALIFPDGRDKELVVPEGLTALTSYSFWIKLFGIFFFLKLFIPFVGQLMRELSMQTKFYDGFSVYAYSLVPLALTAIIIWKSDWIGTKLENKK